MDSFELQLSTDIVFGKGVEKLVGKKVRQFGGSKVLLVYGGGSVKRSGLYDTVIEAFKEEGIEYVDFGGVKPNPSLSKAREGIELARKEGVDFLVAIGGASSIDTAKGIGLGLANPDKDIWKDFYIAKEVPTRSVPLGTIHTISAAGSEQSTSSVLKDEENNRKSGINTQVNRPVFALLNPELTYTVPAYQTAAGATDIIAHVVERYFYPADTYLGDGFSETMIKCVLKYAPIAIAQPDDYESHAELMIAGCYAHCDLNAIGRKNAAMDGSCHALERQMGGLFDTTHGAGLAILMPAWIEYTAEHMEDPGQQYKFAVNVFGVEPDENDKMGVIKEGVRRFREWLKGIGMPVTFSDMGLSKDDVMRLWEANAPKNGATQGKMFPLTDKDYLGIYLSVL
ncbi:MAG: iron-containing alcohol dehydrogenase [Christensenellaceae bacterium]|nr:iron-containing alcohol dehydrogenase [Christensenellaceae bacterium]